MGRRLTAAEFEEIRKCRNSPSYFLYNYGFVQDPNLGKIPFKLYDYQQRVLGLFLKHPFNIILKSRQMGISWLVAGYALWMCLFFPEKRVLMISIKDLTAKALLRKVRFIYKNLPDFLRLELVDDNKSKMSWINDSEIESVPTSEEAGRSESLSLLIIDEAAFVRWIDQIWMSAYPTLATGGSAIILSTPNGIGNFYADLWWGAIEGRNLFHPIRLHWWYRYNKKWFEAQKRNLSQLQMAQEVLGDFITSGNLVFDITALRVLQEECSMITPVEILHPENNSRGKCGLYIFEKPEGENYILSVDLAGGVGGDFHAAHVTEADTGRQVAEYRSGVSLSVFNDRVFELGQMYNYALAAIEKNNMGIATILHFQQNNYPSLYSYRDPLDPGSESVGFPTNSLTRPILIDELETCVRENVSGIRGLRTVNEFMSFAWSKKGKAEAQPGRNDDLVIAYGINRYVRKMSSHSLSMPMILY